MLFFTLEIYGYKHEVKEKRLGVINVFIAVTTPTPTHTYIYKIENVLVFHLRLRHSKISRNVIFYLHDSIFVSWPCYLKYDNLFCMNLLFPFT